MNSRFRWLCLGLGISVGCISHTGPGGEGGVTAQDGGGGGSCPAPEVFISRTTNRTGSFNGAYRWLSGAPGRGPQVVIEVAPSRCALVFSTCNSTGDTTLAATYDCRTPFASNDDSCGVGARITVPARTQSAYVALGSFDSSPSFSWSLQVVENCNGS